MASKDESLQKKILENDKSMENVFTQWKPVLQDVIDNMLTHRGMIDGEDEQGKTRDDNIYDQTAGLAAEIFKNGIIGLSLSESTRWFEPLLEDPELNEIDEVKEYLDEVAHRMYLSLQRSNFYSEISPFILEGSTLGTSCLTIEEEIGKGVINFTNIPLGNKNGFKIAKGKNGQVNMLHIRREFTVRQLRDMFGEENLTQNQMASLKSNTPTSLTEKHEVLHAIFPRDEYDETKASSKFKKWASVWVALEGQKNNKSKILRESGFDEFPAAVWRMKREVNETYGRSSAINLIHTIIGLNELDKDLMKASQLSVDPPIDVPVSQKNSYSRLPGAINYFATAGDEARVTNLGINLPAGHEELRLKQDSIEQAYFVDLFLLIASREGTMTATEVLELQGEKVVLLAPIMSSLSNDAYTPILDRVFSIEQTALRMPEPPEILDGKKFAFTYLGPLAQAQLQVFETKSLKASLAGAAPMVELFPEVLENIDSQKLFRDLLTSGGMDQKYLFSIADVERKKALQQLQLQREQQKLDTERMIDSAKTAAEADQISGGAIGDQLAQATGAAV